MGFLELYATAALVVFAIVTALWLLSVPLRDASIIDMFWGPLFVAVAWSLLYSTGDAAARPLLVTLLVTVWGLRLGFHLAARNLGRGEDARYQRWRENGGPNWWLACYPRVYLLQGGIALAVATPLVAAFYRPADLGLTAWVGLIVWVAGFACEALADLQLSRFKADPGNRGRIMQSGLWGRSRHPNYFGDALQWWGLGLLAVTWGSWWALLGPVVMTAVFLGISNAVLERGMQRKHDDAYADYLARTPAFVPRLWPPKDPLARSP